MPGILFSLKKGRLDKCHSQERSRIVLRPARPPLSTQGGRRLESKLTAPAYQPAVDVLKPGLPQSTWDIVTGPLLTKR